VLATGGSNNNQVLGNTIAHNAAGVNLDASISGWLIQSNVITANGRSAAPGNSGVIIAGGQGNAVRGNAIYANAYLGIDLGNDGAGNASFSFSAAQVSGQPVITATATDAAGNTSEFSHGLSVLTAPGVPVTATEGGTFTATVATFTDPDGDPAGSFTAVIDWG